MHVLSASLPASLGLSGSLGLLFKAGILDPLHGAVGRVKPQPCAAPGGVQHTVGAQ